MNESKLLEESLQLEMKETGFLHRLSGFSSARNLTSQLAYTERTLHFFQRKDLKQDFQNLATNGEKLVEFIESLPANEKQQVGSGWSNISSLYKSLSSLLPVIKSLPSNSTLPESNLTSFGKSLFFLDANKIPEFNFSSMVSSINYLKSSRVGQSEKVLNAEQSLIKLEGLQYASMRQNGTLGTLLGQADNFFTSFFSEKPDEMSWCLIVWIVSGVLVVVVAGPVLVWLCCYKSFPSLRPKPVSPTPSEKSISGDECDPLIPNTAESATDSSTDNEITAESGSFEDSVHDEGKFQYSHPLQYRIATHAAPTMGGYTIASQMGTYFEIYGWLFCNYPHDEKETKTLEEKELKEGTERKSKKESEKTKKKNKEKGVVEEQEKPKKQNEQRVMTDEEILKIILERRAMYIPVNVRPNEIGEDEDENTRGRKPDCPPAPIVVRP
uniref:Uncharacterized protein n=2 Tax=Caenorhabditis japonica TaxID=281687 RepID=A0A8R1I3X4_CAEJA